MLVNCEKRVRAQIQLSFLAVCSPLVCTLQVQTFKITTKYQFFVCSQIPLLVFSCINNDLVKQISTLGTASSPVSCSTFFFDIYSTLKLYAEYNNFWCSSDNRWLFWISQSKSSVPWEKDGHRLQFDLHHQGAAAGILRKLHFNYIQICCHLNPMLILKS